MSRPNRTDHIRLTSHPAPGAKPRFPIVWGAAIWVAATTVTGTFGALFTGGLAHAAARAAAARPPTAI